MQSFTRPSSLPFPSIWTKFQATSLTSNELVEYTIGDLPETHYEQAINLLKENFLTGEFLKKHLNVCDEPVSVDEICRTWQRVLGQRISLACFCGSDLVGVNLVYVDDGWDEEKVFQGAKQQLMYNANKILDNKFDYKKKFGVDKRLNAAALCVDSRYRGRNIGPEILKGRAHLCRALGLKVTVNNFSCKIAQRTAEKAGFKEEASIS